MPKLHRPPEAGVTRNLVERLEDLHGHGRLDRWVILKHCDRFTKGIPDLSITEGEGYRTLWVEVKVLDRPGQSLTFPHHWCDNLVQLETLCRLQGLYYVWDPWDRLGAITQAGPVRDLLRAKREESLISYARDFWMGKDPEEKLARVLNFYLKGGTHGNLRNL